MNVANNVVTILKKPEGYVYADFMKPRCFLTLDQLNSLNSYEPVKRNSVDELPSIYYMSKKYYEDTVAALGATMPASTEIEVTDDFLAATIFSLVNKLTSGPVVGKIVNTKTYSTGTLVNGKQYNLSTVAPEVKGYMVSKSFFDSIQAVFSAEVQEISFGGNVTPDAGQFTLIYDGNETNPLNFNATAADIQAELRTAGLTTAIVTGSFLTSPTGFTVTIPSMGNVSQIAEGTNTLTMATVPVVITITTAQEGN